MEQKETVCSVAKKCGGCRYQGVSYQEQLRRKQRITEGLLKKFGKSRADHWNGRPLLLQKQSSCSFWP